MINNTCFIEVNTVLNKMNLTEVAKIPENILITISQKANNHQIDINMNKMLEEQISKEALSILTYIILKYVANREQKDILKQSLTQNQIQYEQKQPAIKNTDQIFKNKEITNQLCTIEKDAFIKKIINKIKMLLNWKSKKWRKK